MRGLWVACFGVVAMLLFSLFLFTADNLFTGWLYLELAAISLVPCFFIRGSGGHYLSLFSYVLVSSFSSCLIVAGFMHDTLFFLAYVGLGVKFGIFPFSGWVYAVFTSSNWLVIWSLGTLSKLPFVVIFFFLGFTQAGYGFIEIGCGLTLLLVTCLFWVYSFSWEHYWCHVSLASSAVLFLLAGSPVSMESLCGVFLVYFFWYSLAVLFLSSVTFRSYLESYMVFLLTGLLLTYPLSFGVFYKLLAGLLISSCGWWFLFLWVLYSFSEQFYLLKLLMSFCQASRDWGGSHCV